MECSSLPTRGGHLKKLANYQQIKGPGHRILENMLDSFGREGSPDSI